MKKPEHTFTGDPGSNMIIKNLYLRKSLSESHDQLRQSFKHDLMSKQTILLSSRMTISTTTFNHKIVRVCNDLFNYQFDYNT